MICRPLKMARAERLVPYMDELCGRVQGGTGCHRSRDGIGAQHLLRGPLRIGGVHRTTLSTT